MKTRKVTFTFDEECGRRLDNLTILGSFDSYGKTISVSLQISQALINQADEGFSELVVRNPDTKEEKILVVPSIKRV